MRLLRRLRLWVETEAVAPEPEVLAYPVSRAGTVHRPARCLRPDQVASWLRVYPGGEVVGWLYAVPCRRCRP